MNLNRFMGFIKPTLIDVYLFKQTSYLLMITLIVGGGVYLMTDIFDRMDNFMDYDVAFKYVLLYFVVKLPLILAQILPAAFLLSVIIQLCLMAGSKELLALQVGGISLWRITTFFVLFAVMWGVVQIVLSQNLGVLGNNIATQIWREQVAPNASKYSAVKNFWLMEGKLMIYAKRVDLQEYTGTGIVCYELSDDGLIVDRVIRAPTFSIEKKIWTLNDATIYDTNGFVRESNVTVEFEINHPKSGLRMLGDHVELADYSLWQIGDDIKRMEKSGSNVEVLRTGWHMKVSYAASLIVMSLLAVALITWKENIYINIGLGLVITFLFYTMLTVGGALGESGRVSPTMAAWFPLVFVGGLALLRIIYKVPPRMLSGANKSLMKGSEKS